MNSKQLALLEEVKAAGGQLWVEAGYRYYTGRKIESFGRAKMNAAHSMVSAEEIRYCPGGFRREILLTIVEQETVKKTIRNDPKIWGIDVDRLLVKLL